MDDGMNLTYNHRSLDANLIHILQVRVRILGKSACEANAKEVTAPCGKLGSDLRHCAWETMMVDVDAPGPGKCGRRFCLIIGHDLFRLTSFRPERLDLGLEGL